MIPSTPMSILHPREATEWDISYWYQANNKLPRGRWGRRIPFLLVTTPLAAFGMIGLALTPILAKWMHGHFPGQTEVVVTLVCFSLFWAAFELATIAGQAVFGGLFGMSMETCGHCLAVTYTISTSNGNCWKGASTSSNTSDVSPHASTALTAIS